MIIGIDFDNTLVNYGNLFHTEAIKRGLLPSGVASDRQSVRDFLRSQGRDADFTLLQGHIYGPGILDAEPYPHALETVRTLLRSGWRVFVISHKTRFPYAGHAHDLHEFARNWLKEKDFLSSGMLAVEDIFMETSLEAKLKRIVTQKCDYFVDDLPEFLSHSNFPQGVRRILFDPAERNCMSAQQRFDSWTQMGEFLASAGKIYDR